MTSPNFNRPDNLHTALQFNANSSLPELRIAGEVNSTPVGKTTIEFSSENLDAFGRLRVSNPLTLFDSQSRYYNHNQFSSLTNGTASVVYNANQSTFSLNVGNSNGDSVIRETEKVFPYQPGKSLLIMNSFCMSSFRANLRQRVGFFGAQNGIYFEVMGSTLNLVVRSYTSGAIQETRIQQSNWNGDKLDGSDAHGIILNPTYSQIFWIDLEWLGVGSVRCGFIINGKYYLCHTFNHANIAGNTTTYMTTAILPVRFEITNTGATGGNSSMTQICSTVISEGGYTQTGPISFAGTGTSTFKCVQENTYYPIVSIKLSSSRLDAIVAPVQIDAASPVVNYFRFVLLKNATLSNATWTGTSASGTVLYDTGATSVTQGTEIASGFLSGKTTTNLDSTFFLNQLGRNLSGVSDTYTLAVACTTNNGEILAQLGWQELS